MESNMGLKLAIAQRLALLSPQRQAQVLDFIDGLLEASAREEEKEWSSISLQAAREGLVEEPGVEYGPDDLRERYE